MLLQIGKKNTVLKETSSLLLKFLRASKSYHVSAVLNTEKFAEFYEYDGPPRRVENRSSKFGSTYQNSHYTQNFQQRKHRDSRSNWRGSESFRRPSISETSRIPLEKEKFFYVEHPDVTNRSDEEVEVFRKKMNISVKGIDVPKPLTKFSELHLPENLMRVLEEENYSEPSAIQSQGWPVALSGRNMVGVSQTGSGKTLAYMLPAIVHAANNMQEVKRECKPQVLILGPTRELVQQINEVSQKFMKACNLFGACAYGGASKHFQLQCLEGAEICIATPGRLLDFLSGQEVSMENCSYLVLDEADRMLDMGFEPQIRDIIDQIRPGRQTLMWSATWPSEIRKLAGEFLNDFVHITVGSGELSANPNIQQNIYVLNENEKEEKLVSLLTELMDYGNTKVLVFSQTKKNADYLSYVLNKKNIPSLCIHGDVTQSRREKIMQSFRRSKSAVLIATDIAARGLDITDIQHVVNFDFPLNIEDYIHRIGRTARGSAYGAAHSFFTPENSGLLRELFAVLKQANQEINPDLHSLVEQTRKTPMRFNINKQFRRRW